MNAIELSQYLDKLLDVSTIQDTSLNGLQVENQKEIQKIGLAVDISQEIILEASHRGVDFLIVHHGLFWGKLVMITGSLYQRIRLLFENDMALYAVHLPLDVHPEFGNNAQIQHILKWPVVEDFGQYQGIPIGKVVEFDSPRELSEITEDLRRSFKIEPKVWSFGSSKVKRLGYISGSGIGFLDQAAKASCDTLVTGEPKHDAYWPAKEAGLNIILAGHYATETLGVKALGRHLESKFGIKTVFIDMPTGY